MTAVPPALPGTAQNKRLKESHEFTRLLLGKADMRVVYSGSEGYSRPFSVTQLRIRNGSSCPTAAIGVRSRRASRRPPRSGRGAGRQSELFHHIIAGEAGRLAVDCRCDIVALFSSR